MAQATKEKMLAILDAHRGSFVSGEEIAKQLNLSRGAIWKAVKTLQAEGFMIEAVTRKGYCLAADTDVLSAENVRSGLNEAARHLKVEVFREVSSTNYILKERVMQGETSDIAALAESQTMGKGRRTHGFYSPEGTGLYMSILLHPKIAVHNATLLTAMASVAVAEALEKVSGQKAEIKWVNDVYLKGKKVSGILTEGAISLESGELEYVIVGIGINVFKPQGGFPEDIADLAGTVLDAEKTEVKAGGIRAALAADLINRFMDKMQELENRAFLEDYRKRSLVLGKPINILKGEEKIPAQALAIDDDCHLIAETSDGERLTLTSGEISVRLAE